MPLQKNFKNGAIRSIPIVMGYIPIGLAFGILAANVGLSSFETASMSIIVYAGSAQLISLSLIENQAGLFTIVMTTFLVNLRHTLMSAALAPHLGHLNRLQQAVFTYELTDESFAVHSRDFKEEKNPPVMRIITTNVLAHLSWIGGSVLGFYTGSLFTNLESWGIDYALPAMFIALLAIQLEDKKKYIVGAFSMFFSSLLFLQQAGHWYIILAALAGATAGTLLDSYLKTEAKPRTIFKQKNL
ncbi:MAG: AzlC family ABC transporter permease [Firmicutes bacterium]|jgi:4-azaleucine resistance transporter AzlC|nr:AzlC family ABC transporter permease [Bacillota bacterium]